MQQQTPSYYPPAANYHQPGANNYYPPPPVQNQPMSNHNPPMSSVNQPGPSYNPPVPNQSHPTASYNQPAPTYNPPQAPVYNRPPQPTNNLSAPTYAPPASSYAPPAPNYAPPTSPQNYNPPPPPQSYNSPPTMYNSPAPSYYGNQPPRQARLDPKDMPSAAQMIASEIESYRKLEALKFSPPASLPPLVTTLESQQLKFSLIDEGCARPCHMRSTIYKVPVTKEILDMSGLEFSVVIKPFDEREVDGKFYVPLSDSEIVRCNRCKAYINPFSRNGQCCICSYTFQSMQDSVQRPEHQLGSYEFRVTPEYYRESIAETRRPHIIFAIEMTAHSRHMVHYISKNLGSVIQSHFPKDFLYTTSLSPLVGFVTYNSKITLYDVLNGGHAYVISDMSSVTECAPTSKFLVDPCENFEAIEKFLASLVDICNEQAEGEHQTVLGPVVEAVFKTCQFDTSNLLNNDPKKPPNPKVVPTGKMYIFHSSLPTSGDDTTPGRLATKRNIDDMKRQLNTENESKTLAVEGKYYTQLGQKCVNDYGSGVELFLFPPHPRAYMNVATLAELSRLTGTGVLNKYHMVSMDDFLEDLKTSLKYTMAFDASMRVRTSTGITPFTYIGNFNNAGGNLEMSTVNATSNFVVQIKYDDKLPENDLVVIQFAMIYTSLCGERRVRVHNLALSTCQVLTDLYKFACCDTLVNVMMRDTIDKMRAGALNPKSAKEALVARAINILTAYRKHCSDNPASVSQLILPEGLKLLPVYLTGALKCDAIDGGVEMFPDDKVIAQLNLFNALPSQSQVTLYPRMYAIEACGADDEENEFGLTATLTRCFSLALDEGNGQCYVLENGYYLFLYFPNTEIGLQFLAAVFGARKDDPDLPWHVRNSESPETRYLEDLLQQINTERRRALRVCVVRQARDKLEPLFRSFLYEEKKRPDSMAAPKFANVSYVEMLCHLHSEIRSKISG